MTGTDPWDVLDRARTVMVVHAHPDDESLSTGALLAHLSARGVRVVLVTATRGEEGETVPGSRPVGDTRDFVEVRADELRAAAAALGVSAQHVLGTAPALAPGAAERRYRDSGMRWVTPELAGPAEDTGDEAFTRRPVADAVADLTAAIEAERPDVVVSYDDDGTYGHPDHVLTHVVTLGAAQASGVPFVEVASHHDADEEPTGTFAWRDLPDAAPALRAALDAHRTQLTVVDDDATGDIRVRMSGGQVRHVPTTAGVRLHAA